jgi:hypothetical protein
MSKNAMAGAVTLCGVGLCMIGGALLMQNGQQAHAAAGSMPAAATAVAAAANAQAGPTVVWYGIVQNPRFIGNGQCGCVQSLEYSVLTRAWSDGRVEAKKLCVGDSCGAAISGGAWFTVNDPNSGYRTAADINADEIVDGADLASVLGNWGDAPRVPFPPSDCPLNLINP